MSAVWNGNAHWIDGRELEVVDSMPPGETAPDMPASRTSFAPQYEPDEIYEIAARLMKNMPGYHDAKKLKRERESTVA